MEVTLVGIVTDARDEHQANADGPDDDDDDDDSDSNKC